jgi:DNA-binding beta-propeller fold protein YncE
MSELTPEETEKTRRLFAGVVLVALALAAFLGVQAARSRKPGAASDSPPAPTPTPDTGEAPSFREAAAPDEKPFSAVKAPFEAKFDERGRLWVLDSENSRMRIFDRDGGYLGGWGGNGIGNFSFKTPEGLAISGNDVFVADTWNHRVVRYSLPGEWKGSVTGGFMGPRGVAVGKDGAVWVADSGNHRVVRYDPGLQNGVTVGPEGTGPGQFKGPVGITASPSSGRVYVTDSGNHRIQVLDKNGEYLTEFDVPWLDKTWQVHLEVGPDETLYASYPDAGEVRSFDRNGKPGTTWNADDAGEKFLGPVGLALDRKGGILYVVDFGAKEVRKVTLPARKAGSTSPK